MDEEMMRGKPGYEHLNEPLHILVEAELPVEIVDARLMQAREILEDLLKPIDESQDFFKKQQLRELAMLNGNLREEGLHMPGSISPFHDSLGIKRAKTRGGLYACFLLGHNLSAMLLGYNLKPQRNHDLLCDMQCGDDLIEVAVALQPSFQSYDISTVLWKL
ncbi:hypothetical protein ACLOJK_041579 [Asimina triloba]